MAVAGRDAEFACAAGATTGFALGGLIGGLGLKFEAAAWNPGDPDKEPDRSDGLLATSLSNEMPNGSSFKRDGSILLAALSEA